MKPQIRALLIVASIGILIVAGYIYLENRPPEVAPAYTLLEKMEKDGLQTFSITDINGVTIDQEKLKGKINVINFWASWCTPCVAEIPSLLAMTKKVGIDKVNLIAISGDSNFDEMMTFLKSYPELKTQKNIYVVWKDQKEHMKMFNVDRLPETFIFDGQLKLRKKVTGEVDWSSPPSLEYFSGLQK